MRTTLIALGFVVLALSLTYLDAAPILESLGSSLSKPKAPSPDVDTLVAQCGVQSYGSCAASSYGAASYGACAPVSSYGYAYAPTYSYAPRYAYGYSVPARRYAPAYGYGYGGYYGAPAGGYSYGRSAGVNFMGLGIGTYSSGYNSNCPGGVCPR